MRNVYYKSGFTLLEVLVATLLLVVVTVLATGVLSNTLETYSANANSQLVVSQSNAALDEMKTDIGRSLSARLAPVSSTGDQVLLLNVPQRSLDTGQPTATNETVVYCAQITRQSAGGTVLGKRLVRFRIPGAALLSDPLALADCTGTALHLLFLTQPVPQPELLTDDAIQLLSLSFWRVAVNPAATIDEHPAMVRVQLFTEYNANNVSQNVETRTEDKAATPLLLRADVQREVSP